MTLNNIKYFLLSVGLLLTQLANATAADKLKQAGNWLIDLLQQGSVVTLVCAILFTAYKTLWLKEPLSHQLKNILIFVILVTGATAIATELLAQ